MVTGVEDEKRRLVPGISDDEPALALPTGIEFG
jgi:hypothetical protein